MADNDELNRQHSKGAEARAFAFITVFLFPLLAVALVGGYGFVIWMMHTFIGPPGPPL
ncbi:periplasmic nitrate reductase, NapE protein [Halopseudomonas salegens]|uniref:Periplasmic nitrate reductase subunit NapE n=1 Tax=Halopseudomonas salegens TaxID=1434072 RepID=A0A1H2H8X2_9GAMM|nr:periplasmic nitrate reductase, NapE protein [Halopseudomonas salegens]SDU28331.1 periplasmic nitrate reductase subunit NapE [Halopseudomonas salegens]